MRQYGTFAPSLARPPLHRRKMILSYAGWALDLVLDVLVQSLVKNKVPGTFACTAKDQDVHPDANALEPKDPSG